MLKAPVIHLLKSPLHEYHCLLHPVRSRTCTNWKSVFVLEIGCFSIKEVSLAKGLELLQPSLSTFCDRPNPNTNEAMLSVNNSMQVGNPAGVECKMTLMHYFSTLSAARSPSQFCLRRADLAVACRGAYSEPQR